MSDDRRCGDVQESIALFYRQVHREKYHPYASATISALLLSSAHALTGTYVTDGDVDVSFMSHHVHSGLSSETIDESNDAAYQAWSQDLEACPYCKLEMPRDCLNGHIKTSPLFPRCSQTYVFDPRQMLNHCSKRT